MSLLNQVLQDLEKRKEQNIAEQHQLNNIKATPAPQSKSYFLILAIIIFALVITAITFSFNKKTSLSKIVPPPASIQKQAITVKKSTIVTPLKPIKISLATQEKAKPIIKDKIVNKAKISQKLTKQKALKEKKSDPPTPEKKVPVKTSKPLSNHQLAENLFSSTQKKLSLSAKQLKLEQVLKLNTKHINARLQLATTLLQQGLTKQANTVLKQGNLLFPQNLQFINLRSQLLLQKKQADSALTLLQQVDASYIQDETYLGLLAATYQQKNNYSKSLDIYQKLVTINPDKAEYWLGLAIAYDNQANKVQALQAYQQALNKNPLKPVIVSYIKLRISILK